MKFCTERDVFLSRGFCIYYIAELLESNLAHKYVCACGVSVRTSHCFAATPSYGWQSDGNVTPPFLPHSFGCRVWPSATSERTQDMRGSCRTLSLNLQADVWRQQRTGSLLGLLLASHMACCLHPESCLQLPSAHSDCRGLSCFWMTRSFDSPWTGRNLHPQFLLLEPTARTTGREGAVFPCAHLFRCWLTVV